MKRSLQRLLAPLAVLAALATANPHPSVAVRAGYAGDLALGLEVAWDCLLFQPPLGRLRSTLDVLYLDARPGVAWSARYLVSPPLLEGIRFGGGAGLGYLGGLYGFVRGDAEFDLDVGTLPLPAFLGLDAGYATGFTEGAFEGVFAGLRLGVRF